MLEARPNGGSGGGHTLYAAKIEPSNDDARRWRARVVMEDQPGNASYLIARSD